MIITPILDYDPDGVADGGAGAGTVLPPSPAVLPPQGYFYYWPSVNTLTTGAALTPGLTDPIVSLDAQQISQLPANSVIEVVISGRGASQWKRVLNGTSPITNVDAGIIVPVNYDPIIAPYVLIREAGY